MTSTSRQFGLLCLCLVPVLIAGAVAGLQTASQPHPAEAKPKGPAESQPGERSLSVHYLEIVTPKVDETCSALAKAHGVTFGEPVAELGNARTAKLKDGGRIGVRAPMGQEQPVTRPYVLVDDIHAAVKAVEAAGAEILMPPTETPGGGTFAIYYLGKIEHGLWQQPVRPTRPRP